MENKSKNDLTDDLIQTSVVPTKELRGISGPSVASSEIQVIAAAVRGNTQNSHFTIVPSDHWLLRPGNTREDLKQETGAHESEPGKKKPVFFFLLTSQHPASSQDLGDSLTLLPN